MFWHASRVRPGGMQYPNFKMIWFPTFTSYGFWRGAGHPEKEGVRLVAEDGKVLPEVKEIMEMAAEKKSASASATPTFKNCCRWPDWQKISVVRATLDHPLLELNKLLLDEMKQLRDLGVYVGTYCRPMIPSYRPVANPMETIRTIKEIGPDRCIIGSDSARCWAWMRWTVCASSSAPCSGSASSRTK